MITILASLSHLNQVEDVINTAAYIARKYDGHVIGFYPIPGPTIVNVSDPGGYLPLDDRVQKVFEDQEKNVRAKFEDQMKRDGLNFEWRAIRLTLSDITAAIVEHGRETDMIVLSNNEMSAKGLHSDVDLAADIVLAAGRPVLLIPPLNEKELTFGRAVIGWNGSREACRAAFDSLPLIKLADDVNLIWINPEKSLGRTKTLPGTELATALSRHDVNIETKGLSNRSKSGVALISYVKDEGADLLVMGAYGRSRLRERILGGATEYVLRHMTTPVLMSN